MTAGDVAIPITLYGINEPVPGPRWQALFEAVWPAYRAWYLSEGEQPRPTLDEARAQLIRHLPELAGTWETLVDLAGGDHVAARFLTMWNPPAFLPACSQAVLTAPEPVLARNYDYAPELFECVIYSSAFTGRRVIGTGDCLWGLLDGMNDAGLVVSLAFGGRRGSATGFAIPLVVRYLLEVAETVTDALRRLERIPVNMAYNLTLLDAGGTTRTAFVAPGRRPELTTCPVATNHRDGAPHDPRHARAFLSLERRQELLNLLKTDPTPTELAYALLRPPLHQTRYRHAFGTLYTALYRPQLGYVDYLWPDTSWRRRFDSPDGIRTIVLRSGGREAAVS